MGFPLNEWVTSSNGAIVAVSINYRLGLLGFLASANGAVNGTLTPKYVLPAPRSGAEADTRDLPCRYQASACSTSASRSSGSKTTSHHSAATPTG